VTAVLAAAFFCTSILLTLIAQEGSGPGTRLESFTIDGQQGTSKSGSPIEGFQLPPKPPSGPQVPQSQ